MFKKIKRNRFVVVLLGLIILVAFALRVPFLGQYPVGFQIDEASLGYNALSLFSTGMSDEGKPYPLYIDIFGDNRPSGYHFLAIPGVVIFGLSEFSTRLPGAIFGFLTIIPVYLLSQFLTKNKKIGLLAAFLVAVAPWHTVLSRASAETVVAVFFILFGFYFLLRSISAFSTKFLVAAAVLLSISFFFYHTPRVFVPLMMIATALLFLKELFNKKRRKYLVVFGVVYFLIFLLSFSLVFLIKGGSGRFTQVNVFSHPETRLVLDEQLREDGTFGIGALPARIFHNKVTNFGWDYASNYLEYFSGDFLFIGGGLPIWYDVDRMGLLHVIEFPFLVVGVIFLIKKRTKLSIFPIIWIILSPVVAAMTMDDIPNLQRAIVLFPMLNIVTAYGFFVIISRLSRRVMVVSILFVILVVVYSEGYFLHQYFVHGKMHRTWYRNNGFAEMMSNVNKEYNNYDKVVLTKTGGGYPLVLFYSKYDPKTYINEGSPKDPDYKGFGKYIFVPNECPSVNSSVSIAKGTRVIYVDRGTCPEPSKLTRYKNIYREDGSLGFRVVFR